MSPVRSAFLSRRQLSWLIIVCSILVALLSLPEGDATLPAFQREHLASVPLVTPLSPLGAEPRLALSLALPPAIAAEAPRSRFWAEQLRKHLPQPAVAELRRKPDRFVILLPLTLAPEPWGTFLRQARRVAGMTLPARLPSPSGALWPLWPKSRQPGEDVDWPGRRHLRLAATAPLAKAQRQGLAQLIRALPEGEAWEPAAPPLSALPEDQQPRLWVRELAGRKSPDYYLQALVVRWLQRLAEDEKLHLHWQPRQARSRLGFSHAEEALDLEPLKRRALARVAEGLQAIQALPERLRTDLEESRSAIALVEPLSFYQLPLDGLSRFSEAAQQLGEDRLRELIHELLRPDRLQPWTPSAQGDHLDSTYSTRQG